MWLKGTLTIGDLEVSYEVKHFEEGSQYGIEEGRISKLSVWLEGKEIIKYDRGWDIAPRDVVAKQALAMLLRLYN